MVKCLKQLQRPENSLAEAEQMRRKNQSVLMSQINSSSTKSTMKFATTVMESCLSFLHKIVTADYTSASAACLKKEIANVRSATEGIFKLGSKRNCMTL